MHTENVKPPEAVASARAGSCCAPLLRGLAYALPFVTVASLLGTYLLAPRFYLDYVLAAEERERQAVEILTFACALGAGLLLFLPAARLLRRGAKLAGGTVGLVALAALFFAGEEVSWGQSFLGWETPQAYQDLSGSTETNLHNTDIPFRALGTLFLLGVFFVLPGAWALRHRLPVPRTLGPAVAEGPVVAAVALGFLWRELKGLYRLLGGGGPEDRFYWGFVEQMNEQKELLVAMGLLLYAAYRISAVRQGPGEPARGDS